MSDQLSIDLFGVIHGAADGPFAIGVLAVIVVLILGFLWFRPSQRETGPEG